MNSKSLGRPSRGTALKQRLRHGPDGRPVAGRKALRRRMGRGFEQLESRRLLAGTPIRDLAGHFVWDINTPGGDDQIGAVAFNGRFYTTDGYEEVLEAFEAEAPFSLQGQIDSGQIKTLANHDVGFASPGPPGIAGLGRHQDEILVLYETDSGRDSLFAVNEGLDAARLVTTYESMQGGSAYTFSGVAIGSRADLVFLATNRGLQRIDTTADTETELLAGNVNGVAFYGDTLFAAGASGQIVRFDAPAGDTGGVEVADLGLALRDLQVGTLGDRDGLWALADNGDLHYWPATALALADLPAPELFANLGSANQIAFDSGSLYAALDENALMVQAAPLLAIADTDALEVLEGDTATVHVSLSRQPDTNIDLSIGLEHADPDLYLVTPGPLQFTPQNYLTPQPIVVGARADTDGQSGVGTLVLQSDSLTAPQSVALYELEQDLAFRIQDSRPVVFEGAGERPVLEVGTTGRPGRPLDVTITRVAGPEGVSVAAADSAFVLDDTNYRAMRTRNFDAASDAYGPNAMATFRISAPGMAPLDVRIDVRDKDGSQGILVRQTGLRIGEGRSGIIQVRAAADPGDTPLEIAAGVVGDNSEVQVVKHANLIFTQENWHQWQYVAVGAAADADAADDLATLRLTATGLPPVDVNIVVDDVGQTGTTVIPAVLDDFRTIPLQGEQQDFAPYTRWRTNRGQFELKSGMTTVEPGRVNFSVGPTGGHSGMWFSLNHTVAERTPLDLQAVLAPQIKAEYQYAARAILVDARGTGRLKAELKDVDGEVVWESGEPLEPNGSTLRFPLPDPAPTALELVLFLDDANTMAEVSNVRFELVGPRLEPDWEQLLWHSSFVLGNFDGQWTRDRHAFPSGDFDGTNVLAMPVLLAPLLSELGIIERQDAMAIVNGSGIAMLDILAGDSVLGLAPHFVHRNAIFDTESGGTDQQVVGLWNDSRLYEGFWGDSYKTTEPGDGTHTVTWRFPTGRAGDYELFMRNVPHESHATNAPFTVRHAGGIETILVDQKDREEEWISLGAFPFGKENGEVSVSNDANGAVVADALRIEGPARLLPGGVEYSSIDTLLGVVSLVVAGTALGLDTSLYEEALRAIDFERLKAPDRDWISHGVSGDGSVLPSYWDFYGGEETLIEIAYSGVTGMLLDPPHPADVATSPRTYDGAGFIEFLVAPWLPVLGVDRFGVDVAAFQEEAVNRQLHWFDSQAVPGHGASAGEAPRPEWIDVPAGAAVANPYLVTGLGGHTEIGDGTAQQNGAVVYPHYAALAYDFAPLEAELMWDYLISQQQLSPLNHVESFVPQQLGDHLDIHVNSLKGTLNSGFVALGLAAARLAQANPLHQATYDNRLLHAGAQAYLAPAGLTVIAFQDDNQDGIRDLDEGPLAGRTVYLDQNQDGLLNASETALITDAGGFVHFSELPALETYMVREVLPSGWQTSTDQESTRVWVVGGDQAHVELGSHADAEPAELVDVRLALTSLTGAPLSIANVGTPFYLEVHVTDLRQNPAGVMSAFLDVVYDTRLEVAGEVEFGTAYPNAQAPGGDLDGLLDEIGAVAGEQPIGGGEYLLFRVRMTAVEAGEMVLASNPAEGVAGGRVTMFGLDEDVPDGLIQFGQSSLTVVANPYQNPLNPYDVNNDGFETPIDALILINDINKNGTRALPWPPDPTIAVPPYIDPNGDLFLTPHDALFVINRLNHELIGGEGEAIVWTLTGSTSALPVDVKRSWVGQETRLADRSPASRDLTIRPRLPAVAERMRPEERPRGISTPKRWPLIELDANHPALSDWHRLVDEVLLDLVYEPHGTWRLLG